ncbi:MAG: hypothetical protein FD141_273 [Fusobacteria bacterium]|nr:MAG: hypothetical protein FD141_273 [Fusobacteriota bacterium]KAF0229063.1 MAG: hypothetical protein FD182_1319 [Fusobacteriota bacterium]
MDTIYRTSAEKIDKIFSLEENSSLNDSDWVEIVKFVNDEDYEVRYRVCELLGLFPSEKSETYLLSLINDPDSLVRVSAIDSLYFSVSSDTIERLKKSTKEKSILVRGYAATTIGDIQNNIGVNSEQTLSFLYTLFKKEKSEWVKLSIAHSLFLLGDSSYLDYLIEGINSRYYRNRIAAITILEQLEIWKVGHIVLRLKEVLKQRLKIEKAYAVECTLEKLLSKLMEYKST